MPKKVEQSGPKEPKRYTPAAAKALFALSGNRCAFEGCTAAMVDSGGAVLGRVCHIKASRPGGPRFDPEQPAHERHGFHNLLVMCPTHHTEIDGANETKYPPELLTEWKRARENAAAGQELDPASIHLEGESVAYSHSQSGGINAGTINVFGGWSDADPDADELPCDVMHLVRCAAQGKGSQQGEIRSHDDRGSYTLWVGSERFSLRSNQSTARFFDAIEVAAAHELIEVRRHDRFGRPSWATLTTEGYSLASSIGSECEPPWWREA